MTNKTNKIKIYTDGSCLGNPGPGGWCCVLIASTKIRSLCGSSPHTTNNQMELRAIIEALKVLSKPSDVIIYTDSLYVKNAFDLDWLKGWQKNGWRNAQNAPVKNKELWKELLDVSRRHGLEWKWVKGHSGDKWNEHCDEHAKRCAMRQIEREDFLIPVE